MVSSCRWIYMTRSRTAPSPNKRFKLMASTRTGAQVNPGVDRLSGSYPAVNSRHRISLIGTLRLPDGLAGVSGLQNLRISSQRARTCRSGLDIRHPKADAQSHCFSTPSTHGSLLGFATDPRRKPIFGFAQLDFVKALTETFLSILSPTGRAHSEIEHEVHCRKSLQRLWKADRF